VTLPKSPESASFASIVAISVPVYPIQRIRTGLERICTVNKFYEDGELISTHFHE
jgi:hypothetical protein